MNLTISEDLYNRWVDQNKFEDPIYIDQDGIKQNYRCILPYEFLYLAAISSDKIKLLKNLVEVKNKEVKKGIEADYCIDFELLSKFPELLKEY